MKSANVIGPRARMRSTSRSRRVTRAVSRRSLVLRVPTRRTGRPDLRRPDRVARGLVGERDVLGGLPRTRRRELFLREHGDAEALVRRELEVRCLAERAVRAHLDAVAAVDAAHDVELVRLEVALAQHERAGRARLGARAARDAVGVAERDVPRRPDDRVVAAAHEPVAVRPEDIAADPHALRAVDALVQVTKDEVVADVLLVVVVLDRLGAVELVLGEAVLERRALEVAAAGVRAPD